MMKFRWAGRMVIGAVAIIGVLALTGAGYGSSNSGRSASAAAPLNVGEYVTGVLGGRNYFDSADKALQRIKNDFGAKLTVVQGGVNNPTGWEQGLDQLSSTGQDVIVFPPVDDPDGL